MILDTARRGRHAHGLGAGDGRVAWSPPSTPIRVSNPQRERCWVYHEMARWSRGFSEKDYAGAGREGCAAFPFDEFPWTERVNVRTQRSDALVVFGATGDLAFKKIFPSLHAMARRGTLEVPVVLVGPRREPVARGARRSRAQEHRRARRRRRRGRLREDELAAPLRRRRLRGHEVLRGSARRAAATRRTRSTTWRFRRAPSRP